MKIMKTRGGQGRPRSFPSSVSGYQLPTLSKSQSHYSVHSGVMMLVVMVIDNLIEYDMDDPDDLDILQLSNLMQLCIDL